MRWVSLVPSWTETWLELGLNVVGRTRYCIHPQPIVRDIPIVGGTKDFNRRLFDKVGADFLLVDKEENRKEMVKDLHCSLLATHISSLNSVPLALGELIDHEKYQLDQEQKINIKENIQRWNEILNRTYNLKPEEIPGVIEWLNPIDRNVKHLLYIIWKDPLMVVNQHTFIGEMITQLGFSILPMGKNEKYPKIQLKDVPEDTFLLFSSEPYDFAKEKDWIQSLNHPAALVNGESFSWFGIRSLRFLESI